MHHKTIFMPHIVSTSNCSIKITRLYIAVHTRYNIVRNTANETRHASNCQSQDSNSHLEHKTLLCKAQFMAWHHEALPERAG